MVPFSKASKYGKFFAKIPGGDPSARVCLVAGDSGICGIVRQSHSGNTSGMAQHLKNAHQIEPTSRVIEVPKIDQFVEFNAVSMFDRVIAELTCKGLISPHLIEVNAGFQLLFKKSFGCILSRHSVWQSLYETKALLKSKIIDKIKSNNSFSLTCDDWTSLQNIAFTNLNIHFDDGDRFCLGLFPLDAADGKSIADKIQECLKTYDISSKEVFITTDGASNMKSMCKSAKFNQQLCFLHGLNLFCQGLLNLKIDNCFVATENIEENVQTSENSEDSMEDLVQENFESSISMEKLEYDENLEIDSASIDTVKKVRKIMVLLKRSTKVRNFLKKYTAYVPIVDVVTRWNSTLHMLERFILILSPLQKAAIDSPKLSELMTFTQNDIQLIKNLILILKPIEEATLQLSSNDANLITADLVLSQCVQNLANINLKNQLIKRISERRNKWSDILCFLLNQSEDNVFYNHPSDKMIAEFYNSVSTLKKRYIYVNFIHFLDL